VHVVRSIAFCAGLLAFLRLGFALLDMTAVASHDTTWPIYKAHVRLPDITYLDLARGSVSWAPGNGKSEMRFREADHLDHADIVFVGPSSTTRDYDTRVFKAAGLTGMVLGSPGATPVHMFYTLRRYIRLRPSLVLVDITPDGWRDNGVTGVGDLVVSGGFAPKDGIEMALTLRQWTPLLLSVSLWLAPRQPRIVADTEEEMDYITVCHYMEGGWCIGTRAAAREMSATPIPDNATYDEYVARTVRLAREHGARVVMIALPISKDNVAAIPNWSAKLAKMRTLAHSLGAEFMDYSEPANDPFTYPDDFDDLAHLNGAAATRFTTLLLGDLVRAGILPKR
jgi:hypothetical protein